MYTIATLLLMGAFLCAVFTAGAAAVENGASFGKRRPFRTVLNAKCPFRQSIPKSLLPGPALAWLLPLVEAVQWIVLGLMTISCAALLYAFIANDFSLEYVVH